ncbi:hypothetical protein IW262DRAFT_1300521 [Armillaria fumosa]|nr:hypothetical protein IW262DRAFT_1300521 [Armillaria fumosa]
MRVNYPSRVAEKPITPKLRTLIDFPPAMIYLVRLYLTGLSDHRFGRLDIFDGIAIKIAEGVKAGLGCMTFIEGILPLDNFSETHFTMSEESASRDSLGSFSSHDLQKKRNVNDFNVLPLLGRRLARNSPVVLGRGSHKGVGVLGPKG